MSAQTDYDNGPNRWGPLVLPDRLEPPELPLELLPEALRECSRVVANAVQADPAIPAVMGLGALAAIAQKTCKVQAVDHLGS